MHHHLALKPEVTCLLVCLLVPLSRRVFFSSTSRLMDSRHFLVM